ncbi:MAG: hypothetical protein HY372_01400 [Candidatus Andersenbacteria bacterium]|nr:hypothetical protein [Candidatus Andersenbacteria bacterium]
MRTQAPLSLTILLLAGLYAMPAAAHAPTVVIEMNTDGFSPREVSVDANTIINFVNKDSVDRWPASNVHPTHDLYPEFDPKLPIKPGDLWIFKQPRPGVWKYHDHLFPHRRGTIIVEAEKASAAPSEPRSSANWRGWIKQLMLRLWQGFIGPFRPARAPVKMKTADFQNLNEQAQYRYVRQISQSAGPAAAWAYIKTTYTNNAGASLGGRAHDLAHFTGQLVFRQLGLTGLSTCDATFAFGCYHGFTEAAFATSLTPLPDVAQACTTIGPVNSGPWASCIHGIGHGIATYFDSANLEAALNTCDKLPDGATYCHDGVLMEFSFSAAPSFYRRTDPLYPCSQLPAPYLNACGRNQPHVMQRHLQMDRPAIARACLAGPPPIAEACIDALGFAFANESQGNPDVIVSQCRQLPTPDSQARCVAAGAGELIFQNYPNWQTAAPAACYSLPAAYQAACLARLEHTRRNYQKPSPTPGV